MFENMIISYDSEYPKDEFSDYTAEELQEENQDRIKEIHYLFNDYKKVIR